MINHIMINLPLDYRWFHIWHSEGKTLLEKGWAGKNNLKLALKEIFISKIKRSNKILVFLAATCIKQLLTIKASEI